MSQNLFVAVALLTTVVLPAFAQLADAPAPEAFDKATVCASRSEANTAALISIRNARPDEAEMRALLASAIATGQGNSICLADMLGESDDDIANLLAAVASTDDNIDPAAGPEEGTNTPPAGDFGPTGSVGGENPSQLNTPVTGPAASPIVSAPVGIIKEDDSVIETTRFGFDN